MYPIKLFSHDNLYTYKLTFQQTQNKLKIYLVSTSLSTLFYPNQGYLLTKYNMLDTQIEKVEMGFEFVSLI